jgi:hypothetical protein
MRLHIVKKEQDLSVKPFKFFQSEQIVRWRTSNGLTHPIHTISTDHIVNIVRCMNGDGDMRIPNPYEGRTHSEWINIFHYELVRRGNYRTVTEIGEEFHRLAELSITYNR